MANNVEYLNAVKSFKKYLATERGYSPLTVKEYERDLNLFYIYLTNEMGFKNDFSLDKINKYHIAEFLGDTILVHDNAPTTRNRKLYSIRSFFKFLVKYEYIKVNPAATIEASKTEVRAEPIYMKLNDAQKYIETIKKHGGVNLKRDLAIVKLFLYAGLRVSELVGLDLDDIDFKDQSIKFYGKGKKERYVPLHPDVIMSIKNYFPERNEIQPKNEDAIKALFLSRHGKRISVRTIQMMVKKYAKLAGVKNADKITPHKLRHTFASLLYHKTKDLKILQDLLGHADISTTQIYTHTDVKQRKKAIKELPDF
ncbi:tyrosine-type recombinase/integrase [Halothermothrix orenii]|uniref:Phage integrase family protein n=1 Tax=Halothermothrix orenii (strain H 168 / OCM 544 / DSM 9562) TaxID=373903 RepID=B8CX42_HALOH|nr:tyrosine-type recombinase/integrase [Halothermothrix orenii]ACL69861.1 phage integrase family protein [Halothermothrix orenii H 168]